MQKLKKKLIDLSLKKKISLIIFIVISIATAVFMISLGFLQKSYSALLYDSAAATLAYSGTDISGALDRIDAMSGLVLANDTVQNVLTEVSNNNGDIPSLASYYSLYNALQSIYQSIDLPYSSYASIVFGTYEVSTRNVLERNLPADVQQELISVATASNGACVWVTKYGTEHGIFLVRSIKKIDNLALTDLGTLLVCISPNDLVNYYVSYSGEYLDSSYLIYDGEALVYASESALERTAQSQPQTSEKYEIVTINGTHYFTVSGEIPGYGWRYISLVNYNEIFQSLSRIRVTIVVVLAISAFILFAISNSLFDSITKHIQNLIIKMNTLGTEDVVLTNVGYDYSTRNDELGVMHQHFDAMTIRISHLLEDNYNLGLLQRETQFKALEAQLNPHFLYNTLETINWKAKFIGENSISVMVESLGTMMRTILDKNRRYITVQEEMLLVQAYLNIQERRFTNSLAYFFDVRTGTENAKIPKMIIQPLVENAVHYGLEACPDECSIYITVRRHVDTLIIAVKNTNSEFEDDFINKLEKGKLKANGFGIGLTNIKERLRLLYHDNANLTVYNQGEFAVVKIELPYHESK